MSGPWEKYQAASTVPVQQGPWNKYASSPNDETPKDSSVASTISAIARPLLQGGGMATGGVLGLGAGPIGAAGGGVLGYGIGDQAANLVDQKLGVSAPAKSIPELLKSAGQSLYGGAQNEAVGQALGPALKLAGKVITPLASTMSGIPASDYKVLADNPSAILPSSMEKATANLKPAREAFGIAQEGNEATEAAVDRALRRGQESSYVDGLRQKMKDGIPLTPREIVEGNQATNILLKKEKIPDAKRGFQMLKDKFESMMTPDVIATNKEYSVAKSGANFRKILPMTKSGDPAVVRTLYMMSKLAGPQAVISIPAMNAIPTIGAGMASRLATNPTLRRALLPPLLQALQSLTQQIVPDGNQ